MKARLSHYLPDYHGLLHHCLANISWQHRKILYQPDCSYDHKDCWEITIKNALNPICAILRGTFAELSPKISQISKRIQTVTVVRV
jgi:hypothetical protein